MGARTDDNLKIIELKVSVNCCEGCKRKVLKALSIKGVLKTEIHPSQPKLTVYGSVDPQTLIKKLSRCGKTAELCSSEETKLPKIPATTTTAATVTVVDKEQQTKSYSDDAGGKQNSSLNDTKSSNNNNNNNKNKDGDEISNKVKETSGSVAAQVVPEETNTMFATPVVTTVPPMSYVVGPNPNMVHNPGSGGNVMASSHARVYYPMEPHTVLPIPYYTTVSTHYTAPPPPCYIPEHYQYEMPIYRTPPPPMQQQQPMGFSDYFNDDNTVGCHVM